MNITAINPGNDGAPRRIMTATDDEWLDTPIARYIWNTRYRFVSSRTRGDDTVEATWWRVARAAAGGETGFVDVWSQRFFELLRGFRFLPGGRILAGAGATHDTTLFNCFVMGLFDDEPSQVAEALQEGALTMQAGGGVGYDFSTLRPRGMPAADQRSGAEGVVAHLRKWDGMCASVRSRGARRGAMLASLRCDHPDILEFLEAKLQPGVLTRFNLSVQVFDSLIDAVARDATWPLVYPDEPADGAGTGPAVERIWSGGSHPVRCLVHREIRARDLWLRIMQSAWESGEPGVLFVDRINARNTLAWRERITTTNPCGEVPLPPYGACNLGSLNLTRFIREAFTPRATVDRDALRATTATAVRFLDDIIDVSAFPLPRQAAEARDCRRVGLGITGLADALMMLGLPYGSRQARQWAGEVMRTILHAAYRASVRLAQEKAPFPAFEAAPFVSGGFVRGLPQDIVDGIRRYGIRNSHLTAIAPAGTISLLAGNVSSGIEPVFEAQVRRRVLDPEGDAIEFDIEDYAVRAWRRQPGNGASLPAAFVAARDLSPEQHLLMQAVLQPCVDSAISKTINVPSTMPFAQFQEIYRQAHGLGLKGCTVFRDDPLRGAVLEAGVEERHGGIESTCCPLR